MFLDDYFSCPVCGQEVDLHHRSPEFDGDDWVFWHGDGNRKGVCQQLDETGERAMIHFVVEVKHGKQTRLSHRRWTKK